MNKSISILGSLVVVCLLFVVNTPRDLYNSNGSFFSFLLNDDSERMVSYENDLYRFNDSDTLTIAVEKDAAGLFIYNGSYYGYFHALFTEYALSVGKILKIVSCDSQNDLIKVLNSDSVAFGIAISTKEENSNLKRFFVAPIQDSSKYVVLGHRENKEKNRLPLAQILDSARVIYKRGSKEIDSIANYTHTYLTDSSSARFMNTSDYVSLIKDGEYDFLVCKEEEALFYRYNYKDIITTHRLDQTVYSMVITNDRNRALFKEFSKWLEEFQNGEVYEEIVDYYHNDTYFKNFMKDGYLNPARSISHFDDLFRKKSKNSPYPWKLLAAIAFVESKFNPYETSSQGAVGIMQITPRIASHWGVSNEDELRQPKINISIAVKLLNENKRMLKLGGKGEMSENDIRILLACYNAGYGHISDAMRLAKKYKENPKYYTTILKYLKLKRDRKYYSQEDVVHRGSFVSATTENYVNDVMKKYNEYLKSSIK